MDKNLDDSPADMTEQELDSLLIKSNYPDTDNVESSSLANLFTTPDNEQYVYAKFTEDFEKFKVKVDLAKWLIGTVGLTLITFIINWGFKDREQGMNEISQYDRYATELIVLNDNPVNKRMLAQFFSHVTPSEKLKDGWKAYFKDVDKEYHEFLTKDSIAKAKLLKLEEKDEKQLSPSEEKIKEEIEEEVKKNKQIKDTPLVLPNEAEQTKRIIFIQSVNTSREDAEKIKSILIDGTGYRVPNIEFMDKDRYGNLTSNEIRYFREEDFLSVEFIRSVLDRESISTQVKFIPRLSSKATKGPIELWLK